MLSPPAPTFPYHHLKDRKSPAQRRTELFTQMHADILNEHWPLEQPGSHPPCTLTDDGEPHA
jgi:hypothetical protein